MESINAWFAVFLIAAGLCGCYVSVWSLKRLLYQYFDFLEGGEEGMFVKITNDQALEALKAGKEIYMLTKADMGISLEKFFASDFVMEEAPEMPIAPPEG